LVQCPLAGAGGTVLRMTTPVMPFGHLERAVTPALSGYIDEVANLASVSDHTTRRRTHDPRIDVVTMHLAEVHSMPLSRIVEHVAHLLANRARHGGKRRRVASRAFALVQPRTARHTSSRNALSRVGIVAQRDS
jgi:hypothetical protein